VKKAQLFSEVMTCSSILKMEKEEGQARLSGKAKKKFIFFF